MQKQNNIRLSKYIGKPIKLPTVKPVKELAQVCASLKKCKEKSKQDVRNINLFVDEEDTGKSTLFLLCYSCLKITLPMDHMKMMKQ